MKRQKPQSKFVICLRTGGSDDLEPRKVYQVLPDRATAREGHVRVVDESGEDYVYPAEYFAPVRLPAAVAEEFVSPSNRALQPTVGARRRSTRHRLRAVRS